MAISFLEAVGADLLGELKLYTVVPSSFIGELETSYGGGPPIAPGFTGKQIEAISAEIISQLDKRYGPWVSPYPEAVKRWTAAKVGHLVMLRRGVDPNDRQFASIERLATLADSQIALAANAVDGLFDLPLRANTTTSGVTKGGPRSYSERSPYTWMDRQRDSGREEDYNR